MQTKPLDRRIQHTRKMLHESLIQLILENEYDKVTVQDVLNRANVGRSTFYSHYKDLEDLFLSGFENLWSLFEEHLNSNNDKKEVWDLSLIIFQHAQNYVEVYKALVGKQGGKLMLAHLHKYFSALIRESLKPQWGGRKQIPLDMVVHHLASSLIASLTWWVDHDLRYSPARMNEFFKQLTQPAIDVML